MPEARGANMHIRQFARSRFSPQQMLPPLAPQNYDRAANHLTRNGLER